MPIRNEPDRPEPSRAYVLPPISLLDAPTDQHALDTRELDHSARLLEDKFREFSVDGEVVQIHPGPVVSTYEFKPEAGVKPSRIFGLADDLCLALPSESVRIKRMLGRRTFGVEIPNDDRQLIFLRELLESGEWRRADSTLTIALGKTATGETFLVDLARMPHLLMAGAASTGKSVAITAMLASVLCRATPEEARFILIDPKRLELGMFEAIPHLLTPVITDPARALHALNWAVWTMEERYRRLAAEGLHRIGEYNRNVLHALAPTQGGGVHGHLQPLPHIVIVIDDLAALMMLARREVDALMCRLGPISRHVGIHLIVASSQLAEDVVTDLIKAHVPARISFRQSSKNDSRAIIGCTGAEQLLDNGDLIFQPPMSQQRVRLHGPYISEMETARLAAFWRRQGAPVFDERVAADP